MSCWNVLAIDTCLLSLCDSVNDCGHKFDNSSLLDWIMVNGIFFVVALWFLTFTIPAHLGFLQPVLNYSSNWQVGSCLCSLVYIGQILVFHLSLLNWMHLVSVLFSAKQKQDCVYVLCCLLIYSMVYGLDGNKMFSCESIWQRHSWGKLHMPTWYIS